MGPSVRVFLYKQALLLCVIFALWHLIQVYVFIILVALLEGHPEDQKYTFYNNIIFGALLHDPNDG